MSRTRKLSPQAKAVLAVLAEQSQNWLYGLELAAITGIKSGSLYPILIRLAERGLLESQWLDPSEPGRPARHAYCISRTGLKALADAALSQPAAQYREIAI